jgi:predicted flap endonuclease-1-like 5' DNA nuclease
MRSAAYALSLFAVAALLTIGRPAFASHYAVGDVPHLIRPADAEKLHKAGVNTTEDLLTKAGKAKDRKALAKTSGISAGTLLDLARRCDLLRIKGVGSEMVLLLEAAGVKSIAELAKKDAAELLTAMTTANSTKKISEKPPTEPQVQFWIDEAKKLPVVLESK